MGFVVRVLLRLLRWTGRSRQDLILEHLAVRHPIAGLERTARRPALRDRDRRLGSLLAQGMDGVAHASPQRAAGDGRGRAPDGLAPLRALDESRPAAGAPASRSGAPSHHPADRAGEPPLGVAAHRGRAPRPRPHRPRFDGAALPAAARIGAAPHRARVPPAPCPRDRGRRLLPGPDADLADAGCLPLHQP